MCEVHGRYQMKGGRRSFPSGHSCLTWCAVIASDCAVSCAIAHVALLLHVEADGPGLLSPSLHKDCSVVSSGHASETNDNLSREAW